MALRFIAIILIALIGGLSSVSVFPTSGKTASASEVFAGQTHRVEIHKFKFAEPLLNVRVGDRVTWTNMDAVPHTATALDKSWDSGRLKKGESFTLTITDETSLDYFCFYHRQMKASLNLLDTQ